MAPSRSRTSAGRVAGGLQVRDDGVGLAPGDRLMKTNAARILDGLHIQYELRTYEVDPDDLRAGTVARKIGLPPEQVWKTLVARGDRHGVCFAVVPGNAQLDLKAMARLTGDRKVETVPLKEVQPLTGYIRGGVTALGAKKAYPVHVDETISLFDVVSISAGVRGTQILLSPGDYLRATKARVGAIAAPGDAD
jgi:Cys-tRNA(Pro)/Cys-tRNA(Cys) deacylase